MFQKMVQKVFQKCSKKSSKNVPKNLFITSVIKNSAADLANLLPGDIILEANNQPTKEIKDLLDILDKFSSSETIKLKIFRKGTEKVFFVAAFLEVPISGEVWGRCPSLVRKEGT